LILTRTTIGPVRLIRTEKIGEDSKEKKARMWIG
jgi:hypothetical protein